MQDKHKVTLYIPQELHRQLKVRSAVELEPMSTLAERAIVFYLEHPGLVEDLGAAHGQVHRIYSCPSCTSSLVLRDGELASLQERAAVTVGDNSVIERSQVECIGLEYSDSDRRDEGELVPC
jgi:hypothetical protein